MASKAALVALVLIALVAGAAAGGKSGHAMRLRRAEQSLGWMNGMRGGPPTGMQPSVTAATTAHHRAMIGEEGGRHVAGQEEEGKFVMPVPAFKRTPLPPNAP